MKNIILGLLIGIIFTLLLLNNVPWQVVFSQTIMKAVFTLFLALLAGSIALYQVKANVISTARIKWIEEFKNNIAEYLVAVNETIFSFKQYFEAPETDPLSSQYFEKYFVADHKAQAYRIKIKLNLNTKEELYTKISDQMFTIETLKGELINSYDEEKYSILSASYTEMADLTYDALKIEWKKSKDMFYSRWLNDWRKRLS